MDAIVKISTEELRGIVSNCTRICRDLGFTADHIPKILGYAGKDEPGIEQLTRSLSNSTDGLAVQRCRLIIRINDLLKERFGGNKEKKRLWLNQKHQGFKGVSANELVRSGDVSRLKIVVALLESPNF